ncbi:hypothetical protein [Azospirillum griseum]|uniref:Uncharacterized protein n=1 Tax=Azospirillum griseum TaxID=2496639 RepID=A0A3S0K9X8_9PROT|nr:hypothetical protein [Azospirillum griseum]RTR18391.1 hypothetical protein EJ903_16210 [Azospirillum griseum]
MLTIDDCIGLCDLTKAEVDAIAEHEHVPEIVAAEMACCLAHCVGGPMRIAEIIVDDIADARAHGHNRHAEELVVVLRDFVVAHSPQLG